MENALVSFISIEKYDHKSSCPVHINESRCKCITSKKQLSQKRNVTPMSNIQQQIVSVFYKLVQHSLQKRVIALCESYFIFVNYLCSVVIIVLNVLKTQYIRYRLKGVHSRFCSCLPDTDKAHS